MALFAPPHPTIFCHVREKKAPWSLWVTLGEPAGCPHRAAPHYRRYEKSSGAEPSLKKHTGALPTPLSVPPPPRGVTAAFVTHRTNSVSAGMREVRVLIICGERGGWGGTGG